MGINLGLDESAGLREFFLLSRADKIITIIITFGRVGKKLNRSAWLKKKLNRRSVPV